MASTNTLQQLIRNYPIAAITANTYSQRVLHQLSICKTSELGYHLMQCDNGECNNIRYLYHGCRNRHCPHCGFMKKEEWIDARLNELMPVPYYHLVFTVPHHLNSIFLGNRKKMYNLLFESVHYVINKFSSDKKFMGAKCGIISVLHTWGQQLSFHPHIHSIVSGGGIDYSGNWITKSRSSNSYYLFPAKAIQLVFRGYFIDRLSELIHMKEVVLPTGYNWQRTKSIIHTKQWIVHAKKPFGGPSQVVEYLGRYTHKVAISNQRIINIDEQNNVTFSYKDYSDGDKQKMMTLTGDEFLRRYEQHILPKGFTKIRHAGYLSNAGRTKRIKQLKAQENIPYQHPIKLPVELRILERFGKDIRVCPHCNTGRWITLASTEGQEGKGLQILDIKVRSPDEIKALILAHDLC